MLKYKNLIGNLFIITNILIIILFIVIAFFNYFKSYSFTVSHFQIFRVNDLYNTDVNSLASFYVHLHSFINVGFLVTTLVPSIILCTLVYRTKKSITKFTFDSVSILSHLKFILVVASIIILYSIFILYIQVASFFLNVPSFHAIEILIFKVLSFSSFIFFVTFAIISIFERNKYYIGRVHLGDADLIGTSLITFLFFIVIYFSISLTSYLAIKYIVLLYDNADTFDMYRMYRFTFDIDTNNFFTRLALYFDNTDTLLIENDGQYVMLTDVFKVYKIIYMNLVMDLLIKMSIVIVIFLVSYNIVVFTSRKTKEKKKNVA